jgi:ribosomal protein L37AE/L43A
VAKEKELIMRNVCPECEANIVPRLHPSIAASFICRHQLEGMSGDQLRQMFPAAVSVFSEVLSSSKHNTAKESASHVSRN